MKTWVAKIWKGNKSFIVFIALMFVFRSAVADWNEVPTGSMKPTIVEGDRIFVNKLAYDVRLPFTHISLYRISDPKRGDIIVFDSEISDKRLVKRVVGIPGDRVAMVENQLYINGEKALYEELSNDDKASVLVEQVLGEKRRVRHEATASRLSNFGTVIVPEGQYLALGDNRDNSADSRVIGFVPRDEIVGRTGTVVLSLDYDNYYIPRSNRFFQPL